MTDMNILRKVVLWNVSSRCMEIVFFDTMKQNTRKAVQVRIFFEKKMLKTNSQSVNLETESISIQRSEALPMNDGRDRSLYSLSRSTCAAWQHDFGVQKLCGCRCRTLCCSGQKKSCTPLGSLPLTLGRKKFATETFSTVSDDVSVWEHVDLIVGTFRSRLELCVVAKSNVAKFLFDITTDHPLCGGRERISALGEDLHSIFCKSTASRVQTKDSVRQSVIFVAGHCVRHTVTRIHHEARRPSRSVQRQGCLGRHVDGVHVANLKNDLRHTLSSSFGVQRNFHEQNGILFRRELCWSRTRQTSPYTLCPEYAAGCGLRASSAGRSGRSAAGGAWS